MGWEGTFHTSRENLRRQNRGAQKRLRELERQSKEQTKLSAIEQARLEVETYESALEVLISVHKETAKPWDWLRFAAALPPPTPHKFAHHELKARLHVPIQSQSEACAKDEQELQNAMQIQQRELAHWEKMRSMARRILDGEYSAYQEALAEFSGLEEISDLGSAFRFHVHSALVLDCNLKVNGQQAIPSELKSLTATGKLSIKPMPKARFHELYQDYVCSGVLRTAREIFALLPVETVLVTASVDLLDPRINQTVEQPVLSVAFPRIAFHQLDFENLDPSDAIESFLHRGDAKASRKSGEFEKVTPLTPVDLPQVWSETNNFRDLLAEVVRLRSEIRKEIEKLDPQSAVDPSPFR